MTIIIGSAIVLSFSGGEITDRFETEKYNVSSIIPVAIAAASGLFFGARGVFIKYFAGKGYNVYNIAV